MNTIHNLSIEPHKKCAFDLFLCLSRKYSSDVFKFTYIINIWYSMNRFENDIHKINGSLTETHKISPIHYGLSEQKLQSILTYLYSPKYN